MALDPGTGEELWSTVAGDPAKGETFPAAPIAWNGMVFMGNAGGDNFAVKGRMMAFDVKSGGRLWSFDLVPEEWKSRADVAGGHGAIPEGRRRVVDVVRARHHDGRGLHAHRKCGARFHCAAASRTKSLHVLRGRAGFTRRHARHVLSTTGARLPRLGYRGCAIADHHGRRATSRGRGGQGRPRLRHRSRDPAAASTRPSSPPSRTSTLRSPAKARASAPA